MRGIGGGEAFPVPGGGGGRGGNPAEAPPSAAPLEEAVGENKRCENERICDVLFVVAAVVPAGSGGIGCGMDGARPCGGSEGGVGVEPGCCCACCGALDIPSEPAEAGLRSTPGADADAAARCCDQCDAGMGGGGRRGAAEVVLVGAEIVECAIGRAGTGGAPPAPKGLAFGSFAGALLGKALVPGAEGVPSNVVLPSDGE